MKPFWVLVCCVACFLIGCNVGEERVKAKLRAALQKAGEANDALVLLRVTQAKNQYGTAGRFRDSVEHEALLSFETCRYLQVKGAKSKPRQSED